MQSSKETRILNCVCTGLVLLSGVARLLWYGAAFTYNNLICTFFLAAAFIWIYQLRRRLLQPEVQRNLTMMAGMLAFWIVLRTIKYEFLPQGHFLNRYVWYLYYLPQIFCVLWMFFSVLYIGLPYDRTISRKWKLLYIPAFLLVGGVLTNDLHQKAFRFPEGDFAAWSDHRYLRGPLYLLAMLWIVAVFIAIIVVVFSRCAVPQRRRKIWLPLLTLVVAGAYALLYLFAHGFFVSRMLQVPEMMSFIYCAFMECLILTHLLPSNDNYAEFWEVSSIGAGIMDEKGRILCRSRKSAEVTDEQIRQAKDREVLLQDRSISLRSHVIQGGYGYWTKDISELNRLNQELQDLGDVLAEENAILNAETKLKAQKIQIEQQSSLYDRIARNIHPVLLYLEECLDTLPLEEAEFEQAMKYACLLDVYIKRYSNLLLLEYQNQIIWGDELRLAVTESLEYVSLYGIKTYGDYRVDGAFQGKLLLLMYQVYQQTLMCAIPGADAILVHLNLSEEDAVLCMELNAPKEALDGGLFQEQVRELGGMLEIELDQKTEYVTLSFPGGGGDV